MNRQRWIVLKRRADRDISIGAEELGGPRGEWMEAGSAHEAMAMLGAAGWEFTINGEPTGGAEFLARADASVEARFAEFIAEEAQAGWFFSVGWGPHGSLDQVCRYVDHAGLCRYHHQIKQHVRWALAQLAPGIFQWATPTGRTYLTLPDSYAA